MPGVKQAVLAAIVFEFSFVEFTLVSSPKKFSVLDLITCVASISASGKQRVIFPEERISRIIRVKFFILGNLRIRDKYV